MFIYKDGEVTIEPKMLFIPEFKKIWERDTSKKKEKAKKEFAFIYFMADFKSEYNSYGLEKEDNIAKDIMGNNKYKADELILEAIEKYEKLQETYSMRYLKSVRQTIDSLIKYYEDISYSKSDKTFSPEKVIKASTEIEKIIITLEKWERKVQTEEIEMTIRGGGKVGMFEDEDKATWIHPKKQ